MFEEEKVTPHHFLWRCCARMLVLIMKLHETHKVQEAQLPLRNRASAIYFIVAKLLSIAVMTYTYVYHLRNLRPMIRPISYAHSE